VPPGRHSLLLFCLLLSAAAAARPPSIHPDQFALCPINPLLAPTPATTTTNARAPLIIQADRSILHRRGTSLFRGNVVATRGNERLWADLLRYDQANHIASGRGHIRYAEPFLQLAATHGNYDFATDQGNFFNNQYQIPSRHGRGTAIRIKTYQSKRSRLFRLTYTTCPLHRVAWRLHAGQVLLDNTTEVGFAHNVWVSFKGVPILWTPYLSFPLTNRRKSGFLFPSLSQNSTNGLDIEIPYYWNIAANMDMTLTPRIITHRGIMLMDTYRYLFPGTRGQLHFTYLPHDRASERSRGLAQLAETTRLGSHWQVNTSLEYVSDPYYLEDFGTSLRQVSQTYQRRLVSATYRVPAGSAFITLEDLAPLDPTLPASARPYRKLPEVGFNFAWPDYRTGLTVGLGNDFTRFQAPARPGALRDILTPSISQHFGGASWYLTPRLAYQEAHYNLDASGSQAGVTLNRSAPIFSIASGLDFERNLGTQGWLTQTLEPEAFYLYIPYRNQTTIPIFDTYRPPLDFQQLFAANRFVGPDRLGDANQLTLALHSRFINSETGNEMLSLGLGQILYFRNREVTLPGRAPATTARSDYVGEITANLGNHLFARGVADYNPYNHRFDQGYVSLQYRPNAYRVLNLGYLYRSGELDQTDISFAWPLGTHWSLFGRWNYSLRDHQTIETLGGLQYDTCCWRLRIAQRRFVTFSGGGSSAIFFELQLKGLGSLGNRLSGLLRDDIYGYGNTND